MLRVVVALGVLAGCGRVSFTEADASEPPGTVLFADDFEDGVIDPQWTLLRFAFAEQNGRLETLPMARPGFDYGHFANGRSGVAALHIGDRTWIDLRVEWTQQNLAALTIVDAGLQACHHTPSMMYRMVEYSESWNAPQNTYIGWSIEQGCEGVGPAGTWGRGAVYQYWIPGYGWSASYSGAAYQMESGFAAGVPDEPLRFVVELRGATTKAWLNRSLFIDADDASFVYPQGVVPPAFGGVGFSGSWEQMFWIDDVVITKL